MFSFKCRYCHEEVIAGAQHNDHCILGRYVPGITCPLCNTDHVIVNIDVTGPNTRLWKGFDTNGWNTFVMEIEIVNDMITEDDWMTYHYEELAGHLPEMAGNPTD